MVDFSKLKTPPDHGQVLVVPEPAALVSAVRANSMSLRDLDRPLLDSTLGACRRRTREAIVGRDDRFVIVTGHGPAFIHPGVWAKHIVAMRLATAVDGVALNLVVDNDAPRSPALLVPTVSGERCVLKSVEFARLPAGHAYEQIARLTAEEVSKLERAVCEAMGDRYDESQMPEFFRAFSTAADGCDWVDQAVAARRAVEAGFGVSVDDRRVSSVWCSPLLLDMLADAQRFAHSYNGALQWYRREHRVRGAQRPIPDLHVDGKRCEVAVWAYRIGSVGTAHKARRRLFVENAGDKLRLFADDVEIGVIPLRQLKSCADLEAVFAALSGWRLRPRALTLTIWARLLLADLFIHGIGGAKYDRITDAIIADYYGLTPPAMACVSATLQMDLPHGGMTNESVLRLRHALRDLEHNPQRNLPAGPDLDPLIERRVDMVRQASRLRDHDRRNHQARHRVFTEIRDINATMLGARQDALAARRSELAEAVEVLQQNEIARGREYFFGLYDRARLELLLQALPTERDFRV